MELCCKRCGSAKQVKNGLMRGQQRYLCKGCGLNFTDTPPRGKPLALKAMAVLLYVSGLSMNRTAKLLGVSTPTIQAWLEPFAQAYAQKPEPEGRAGVIELDEMWHDLKKSLNRSGSGRLGIVRQGSWWTGNAAVVTRPPVNACSSA
jgi:transposase